MFEVLLNRERFIFRTLPEALRFIEVEGVSHVVRIRALLVASPK